MTVNEHFYYCCCTRQKIRKAVILIWLQFLICMGATYSAYSLELSSETLGFDMRAINMHFEPVNNHKGTDFTNTAMINDDLGYLWVGAQDGLIQLDGHESKRYIAASKTKDSLVSNYILSLAFEAKHRCVWIGTANGLSTYNVETEKFVSYKHDKSLEDSLSDNVVQTLLVDSTGRVWIGTKNGLNLYVPVSDSFEVMFHIPNTIDSLSHDNILDIKEDSAGNIWIATQSGLNRFLDNGGFKRYAPFLNDDGSDGLITKIAIDKKDNLWLGTEKSGLLHFNPLTEKTDLVSKDNKGAFLPSSYVRSLLFDNAGDLWVGTSAGLSIYNTSRDKFVTISNNVELSGNVISLHQDNQEVIWVGTASRGLHRYNPRESQVGSMDLRTLKTDGNILKTMAKGSGDQVWFSSAKNLYKMQPSIGMIVKYDISLINQSNSRAIPFVNHASRRDYIMTDHIYDVSDSDNLVKYELPKEIRNARWYSATIDWQGRLWLGSRSMGIYVLSADFKRIVYHFQSAIAGYVKQIDEQTMLIGSLTATYWINVDTFETEKHLPENTPGMLNPNVTGHHFSSNGDTWLATSGGIHQLLRDNKGNASYKTWTTEDGLPTDVITGPLADKQGNLWFSSTNGLFRFDTTRAADTGDKLITKFDRSLGALANYYIGQYIKNKEGLLLFQGPNGISIVDQSLIRENSTAYNVVLNEFSLQDLVQLPSSDPDSILTKSIQYTDAITLSPEDRNFTFGFTTTSMPRKGNIQYFYRLIGFDNRWLFTDAKNRRLKYTNLDPGKYRFEIYSVSDTGVKSDIRGLDIKIRPHFYETLWFQLLAGSLFFLMFILWYKYRIYKIEKYNHQLEAQVQQRTQDIKTLADIAKDICFLLDIHELLQQIYVHLNRSLDVNALAIGIYEEEKKRIKFERSLEMGNIMPLHFRPMDPRSHLAAWCIHNNKEIVLNSFDDRFKYLEQDSQQVVGERMQTVIYLPIRSRTDEMLGCITVQSHTKNAYDEVDIDFIRTISNYTGIALDNAIVHSELKRVSATDFLTGLPNRRSFLENAHYQVKAIRRTTQTLIFAMADLDGFKAFNDEFGHDCGDYVLKKASELFRTVLRSEDLVGRWGGEEFIFMFPNTGIDGAITALEKLRAALNNADFEFQGLSLNVSSTFGACEYSDEVGLDETINRADSALYQGKQNGRNRVEVFKGPYA